MGDDNSTETLPKDFSAASTFVKSLVGSLKEEQMLQFYGLYKQAKEGSCNKPKPSWFSFVEKQKWEAWSGLGNMDSASAMRKYIELLNTIEPGWQEKKMEDPGSWTHHSCFKVEEEIISDSNKTIFDWVKENNFSKVESLTKDASVNVNVLDEEGLGLLHWAADRGHIDIVKHFIQKLKADINIKDMDGQTPLHYAASCGHKEIVKFLVGSGADVNLKDNEENTPLDVSSNTQIEDILKHVQIT